MEQHTINFYINHIYALSWCIKHVGNKVWSGAHGSDYDKSIKYGFETMCIVHEAMESLVPLLIYLFT